MAKISEILREGEDGALMWHCPGCNMAHQVRTGAGPGPRWGYNGNPVYPTFVPSVLVRYTKQLTDEQIAIVQDGGTVEPVPMVCHSFVENGEMRFLEDCTHELAGKTVPIPPFDPEDDLWR